MGISQRLFDLIPNTTLRNKNLLHGLYKTGDILGRPMQNRLIMGATAIVSQPFIDRHNKRVDEDTAKASMNRTIGKIIAGTTVGCIVRGCVYELIKRCTDMNISTDNWNNLLTPRSSHKVPQTMLQNMMRNYKTVLATLLAFGVMLFTNVLIDMPFTNAISNFLNKKSKNKNLEQIGQKPISSHMTPRDKIKDTFNIHKGGTR